MAHDMSQDEFRAWQEHDRARDAEEATADMAIRLGELLELRTEALARVVAQLDAVRKIHQPVRLDERQSPWCDECTRRYPCPTAKAAGVPTT